MSNRHDITGVVAIRKESYLQIRVDNIIHQQIHKEIQVDHNMQQRVQIQVGEMLINMG